LTDEPAFGFLSIFDRVINDEYPEAVTRQRAADTARSKTATFGRKPLL
jgi:hypothetical protein